MDNTNKETPVKTNNVPEYINSPSKLMTVVQANQLRRVGM
jgi:hypothetical protein